LGVEGGMVGEEVREIDNRMGWIRKLMRGWMV
jgi:hypothetical protein